MKKTPNADSFKLMSFNVFIPMVRETQGDRIGTPDDSLPHLRDIQNAAQECFVVMTLNTKNRMIDRHLITIGTVNASLAHPREVFRAAIADNAASIIIAHNHPSGDPSPSTEDLRITRQLVETGRILDIPVLDHLIIGRTGGATSSEYISLREAGLVSF